MATISPASDFTPVAASAATPARTRDPRLDFYRGIAMFIILIAHIPGDPWARWIPARFGYSDA
ncbi:MAG: OpgC domain-containing protein, partial [Ruegeria sp.]